MKTSDSPVLSPFAARSTPRPSRRQASCKTRRQDQPRASPARALGDLSHKVCARSRGRRGGRALFIDTWLTAQGIGQFFSNAHVQEQGAKLFAKRDAVVWMPARGAFQFNLPAAQGRNDRYLGIVRGVVKSPEQAMDAFSGALEDKLADARRRGQLSHDIYFRVPTPGETLPPEMLGVDVWCDAAGMQEHYRDIKGLDAAFAGKPAMSVWEQASGGWSEW